jgi:hypothetical protein
MAAYVEREKRMDERAAWPAVAVLNVYRGRRQAITTDEFLGRAEVEISDAEYDRIKARIAERKAANG